jgi:hypothetical protein
VSACRICRKVDCYDDCEELAAIYREAQREKLRDVGIEDEDDIEDECYDLTWSQP